VFRSLRLLGAVGTISAACFLHTWLLAAATVVALIGLIVTLAASHEPRRALA
jgi:membrane protein YdbS with pleckstrin-like domain